MHSSPPWEFRAFVAIGRLLTFLGYRSGKNHEDDLARFLTWLAFVEAYVGSQDSEVRATWTEAALRALGNTNRLTTTSAAEEAASLADGLIAQQLRRFPPREPIDDGCPSGLTTEEQVELTAWRMAGGSLGCDKPSDLANHATTTKSHRENAGRLRNERDEALAKLAERDADLLKYAAEIDELRKQVNNWQASTGCVSPGEAHGKIGGSAAYGKKCESEMMVLVRAIDPAVFSAGAAEDAIADAKSLLAKILNVEPSTPLFRLAQGVAEMVAARTRAVETLSEREASKLRADLQSTLRELATVREQCTLEKTRRMDTEGRISDLQKRALVPQDKPSKVEQGQRWVRIFRIQDVRGGHDDKRAETDSGASYSVERMGTNPDWVFLGYSF